MNDKGLRIQIYTDGGANPNPGTGGWGVVVVDPKSRGTRELSGTEPDTTNNRMELTAAIRALESLPADRTIDLHTDSTYVRRGITEWLPGWVRNGWRRRQGELRNEDLWRRLATLAHGRDVRWHWLKGHAGHEHNERADALATMEIERIRSRTEDGVVPEVATDGHAFLRVRCIDGRGVWAATIRIDDDEQELRGSERSTTANRLDLIAACRTLADLPTGTSVTMHTNSDYLRNGVTRWLEGWRRRSWTTADGSAVKNDDLWRRLDRLLRHREVVWVKSGPREPETKALVKVLDKELRTRAGD